MDASIDMRDVARHPPEMVPAILAVWQGDYEHSGEFSKYPTSRSVPNSLQKPHPPIRVAMRAPVTYEFAEQHGFNIISWPLTRPMSEAELGADESNPAKVR